MTTNASRRRRAAFAAVLLAGTALGGAAGWLPAFAQGEAPAPANPPAVAAPQVALPGFADLVAQVRPAVVTITATETAPAEQADSPFPSGTPQDRMFRHYFGGKAGGAGRPQQVQALGSGFIVDAQGHVVTNNHVVADATQVKVTLDDGRELSAKVVGRDARSDLALLKVEAGGALPFLRLGDSDKARPGDWVVAVGNPYGLGGTVTAGIVSARGRDIHSGPYDDFLQVDAPINRGNSGGPLFAQDGSVIGVNTAIFSPSGGSIGIGFAIPSNLVRSVVAQLEQNGRVERGYIGVSAQPVDATLARALHLARPDGALVAEVQADSPAARAGLRPGDVVTAVGEAPVRSPRDLARAISSLRPGSPATLTARRDGQETQVSLKVVALPDQQSAAAEEGDGAGAQRGRLGLGLATVQEAQQNGLDLPRGTQGVVIAQVEPASPAAEAGLRAGDVITSVGGRKVRSPQEAIGAIREAVAANDGAVALQLLRDGHSAFVAVQAAPGAAPRQG
jgi:serine protease Do